MKVNLPTASIIGAVTKEKFVRVVSAIQVSMGVATELSLLPLPGGTDIVFSSWDRAGSDWVLFNKLFVEFRKLRKASPIFSFFLSEIVNSFRTILCTL